MSLVLDPVVREAGAQPVEVFKSGLKPVWCPGCGHYGVLAALERALAAHGRAPHEVVLVSGIGCSSRAPAYTSTYGFHGVHGRALPVATGVKLARPELEVIAIGGDGDGYAIGGNHFLHACRRNIDIAYVVMDNRIYGMTKGQPSPTTEADWRGPLAEEGLDLEPLNPLAIAIAAGASFVARGYAGDPNGLAQLILEGIHTKGFAIIEALSACVTYRPESLDWKTRIHARHEQACTDASLAARELMEDDGFGLGVFYKRERPRPVQRAAPCTLDHIERAFERVAGGR
jgi:2-oxoglutarate ferredoxin oxidoreductase subunit beta